MGPLQGGPTPCVSTRISFASAAGVRPCRASAPMPPFHAVRTVMLKVSVSAGAPFSRMVIDIGWPATRVG